MSQYGVYVGAAATVRRKEDARMRAMDVASENRTRRLDSPRLTQSVRVVTEGGEGETVCSGRGWWMYVLCSMVVCCSGRLAVDGGEERGASVRPGWDGMEFPGRELAAAPK